MIYLTIIKWIFSLLIFLLFVGAIVAIIVLMVKKIIQIPYINDDPMFLCANNDSSGTTTLSKRNWIGQCTKKEGYIGQVQINKSKQENFTKVCIYNVPSATGSTSYQGILLSTTENCPSSSFTLLYEGYMYFGETAPKDRKKACIKTKPEGSFSLSTDQNCRIDPNTGFYVWI
jgi:hypothetical protein